MEWDLATYASVRSANAAARTAERSMLQTLRPLLFPSRLSESATRPDHAELHQFRRLTRDLYSPPGEVFFWQVALRDTSEQLLYGDEEGVQHTVTRYAMIPHPADDGGSTSIVSVGRHWNIDGPRPR